MWPEREPTVWNEYHVLWLDLGFDPNATVSNEHDVRNEIRRRRRRMTGKIEKISDPKLLAF